MDSRPHSVPLRGILGARQRLLPYPSAQIFFFWQYAGWGFTIPASFKKGNSTPFRCHSLDSRRLESTLRDPRTPGTPPLACLLASLENSVAQALASLHRTSEYPLRGAILANSYPPRGDILRPPYAHPPPKTVRLCSPSSKTRGELRLHSVVRVSTTCPKHVESWPPSSTLHLPTGFVHLPSVAPVENPRFPTVAPWVNFLRCEDSLGNRPVELWKTEDGFPQPPQARRRAPITGEKTTGRVFGITT